MALRFNESVGEQLDMPLEEPLRKLEIFVDCSSVEIFANDGAAVFTTHLYPVEGEFSLFSEGEHSLTVHRIAASVTDDFVV